MVGWHRRLNGHEFEQPPGVGDGQGVPACCGARSRKEADTTERLNRTDVGEKPGLRERRDGRVRVLQKS